ncbi:hypothetical protein AAHA92_21667 [Salvia divinorum]|uniref:Myb-like domain-containing protein n=1 Tax=Salvia divinorum TaxID=28513 RepID=A0ABD1GL67_SALDI
MASSSGTYKEGANKQSHNSASSSYNGASVHGEWGIPTFQHQKTISMDWTIEEHALLLDYLAQYGTNSAIICYAKIAVLLKTKTVRDVALRCRWMTKKEMSKRRKDDLSARKSKERKEMFIDSTVKPSRLSIQSGVSQAPGVNYNCSEDNIPYNDLTGVTQQLLQHNAWALKQISKNLSTHQIHQNIGLLSQARDNIFKILTILNEMGPVMKRMPQLPKLNEELANSILSSPNFPIQL